MQSKFNQKIIEDYWLDANNYILTNLRLIVLIILSINIIVCQSASKPPVKEFVSKRHDNGLKELVLVFEGEGIDEILVAKYGFYDDGLKKFIELHENNKLNGLSIYWHSNGQISKRITYKDGKKNGQIEIFYEDGSAKAKGAYIDDIEDGKFLVWNNYDGSKEEFTYENGRKNGLYSKANSDGKKILTGNYLNDLRTGQWDISEPFYFDGEKTIGRTLITYKEDEPNGRIILYHPNQEIQATGNYNYGEKDGEWKFYNDDGLMTSKGAYKKGYFENEWEWFDKKGKLETKINYKNNKKNGLRIDWNEKSVKVFEGYYLNDKLEGKAKNWNDYGNLYSEGYYRNNYKNGLWTQYDLNSIIIEELIYQRGKIIERTDFSHYENGILKSKSINKSNGINLKKYGSFETSQEIIRTDITYFKNESVESISNYNYENVIVGKWLKYSTKGIIDTALYHFDNSWVEKTGYYNNNIEEVTKGEKYIDIFTAVDFDYWNFENDFEKKAFEILIENQKEKEIRKIEKLKQIADKKFQKLLPLDKEIVASVEKKLKGIYTTPEFEIYSYFGFYGANNPFDDFSLRKNEYHQILKGKKNISIKKNNLSKSPPLLDENTRKATKWTDKNLFPVKSFSGKTKRDKRKNLAETHIILMKDYMDD